MKGLPVILVAIIACEIGFWLANIGGLVARYVLRRPRLGAALLLAAPVIDLILLVLVGVDLLSGGTASWHHGLAALYIGISVAYGHRMVAWADAKFAEWFRGAKPRPARYGWDYARSCWRDVPRTLVAVAIAAAVLGGLILLVGAPDRTSELMRFFPILGVILAADTLGALSYTVWPKRAPTVAA